MNEYFKMMLAAKKSNKKSFMYNGNKYVRKLNKNIVVYKRASVIIFRSRHPGFLAPACPAPWTIWVACSS